MPDEIQPRVEKLVGTQAGNEVDLESCGLQVLAPNVQVAFKRRDARSTWSLCDYFTAGYVRDSELMGVSHSCEAGVNLPSQP